MTIKSKCSLCGALVKVTSKHQNTGIKCENCIKKINANYKDTSKVKI